MVSWLVTSLLMTLRRPLRSASIRSASVSVVALKRCSSAIASLERCCVLRAISCVVCKARHRTLAVFLQIQCHIGGRLGHVDVETDAEIVNVFPENVMAVIKVGKRYIPTYARLLIRRRR